MAYSLHIVRTQDFLRLDPAGNLDYDQTRAALSDLASHCVRAKIPCALLDIRDLDPAKTRLSMQDIYNLARTFHEMGFRKEEHRFAILHRYRAGDRADLFASLAKADGWHVETFETFEDAMEWFGSSEPVVEETSR
jgi:hypothetical protein